MLRGTRMGEDTPSCASEPSVTPIHTCAIAAHYTKYKHLIFH